MLPQPVQIAMQRLSDTYAFSGVENKGANGFVFFGTNRVTGVPVAIKFYWWGEHPELHSEPRVLAQVSSDHIVPIQAAELVGGGWALFVTPRFSGDLEGAINRGAFSLHRALDLARNVYSGLGALHGIGIVHRDLKPANILVSDQGRAVIGDFGSVATLSQDSLDVVASGHSIIYRPPESFLEGRYTKAGDLYQVGIVMYEMLAGPLPVLPEDWVSPKNRQEYSQLQNDFDRSQYVDREVSARVRAGRILNFSNIPFCVPKKVRQFIKKQTSIDAAKRARSAADAMSVILTLRRGSLDWVMEDGIAFGRADDVVVRVEPSGAGSEVHVERGSGFRRDRSLESNPAASCELANSKFR